MKDLTAKDCISLLEENESKIKDAITELYTSYVLAQVRHELWMYVDDEGEVSLKMNIGYAATQISNEERFFIYSCGGENMTAWDVLPRIEYLLNGEELRSYVDAVNNVMGAVYDAVMDKVNNSWSWGRDLIQNLVNGIRYLYADVVNAVADVANAIWEYLHFSVPEKGPLTTVNEWMPDFMKGLADGIDRSRKYVEKAVESVSGAMQLSMQSGLEMKLDGISGAMLDGGAGGTVINNYNNDNSRTVNQTNNSPKSLSRLEIYRQTRNALNV